MCPPTSQPLCVYAWHSHLIKRIYSFASSSCRSVLLCVLDFSSCPLFKETTTTTCHRPHPCFVIFVCFYEKHLLASRLFNSPGSPSTLLAAQSQSTLLLTSLYHFTSLCEALDSETFEFISSILPLTHTDQPPSPPFCSQNTPGIRLLQNLHVCSLFLECFSQRYLHNSAFAW